MTEQMTEQAAPVEAAVQEVAPKWAPEVETEARALGWKAPDEWKGEVPAGYIDDPTRYLERAENFTPFRKMREQTEERLRKIEAVATKALERERTAHQQELARIKAEKIAAVETGDVDAYKALEKREEAVVKQMEPEQAAGGVPPDHRAAIENWSVDKPWFKADPIKTNAAAIIYGQAQQSGLTDPKAILAYVDREMAKQFADLAPKQPQAALVEGGLSMGGGAQASAFEKLPKDAKDAFRRFVEKGVFRDTKEHRATYAEDYDAA